ncbi:CBS domain-containing protein [Sphaerisporangium aureirubrum]|uniref:CBS domain-containing protein n=1 Tax=Sphaerisporangium aureirubrum TaxID=1544736 RepID=A0ABW1NND2_9ACTN
MMRVGEVMGRVAIAVERETSFADLVETMRRFKVGAVAVVDEDRRPVGVVSADDLLLRETGVREGVLHPRRRREEFTKATSGTASGVMTSPAITVTEGTPVREAAQIMHDQRVKQLPVVDAVTGRIVGTVHQADLLKIFTRSRDDLRAEVADLVRQAGVMPEGLSIGVDEGRVTLDGRVPRRSQSVRIVEAVRGVEGVIDVHGHLAYEHDDLSALPPSVII